MQSDFPNDSDGDSLRKLIERGSDLSKPMFIDFQLSVNNETGAKAIGDAARALGYHVKFHQYSDIGEEWICECSTRMLATYDGIIAMQRELSEICSAFGGYREGWGTYGNGPDAQPAME